MAITNEEFYLIVPQEATNEVLNPSVETNTTGYTAVGAGVSIARSSTQQRRGTYSLEITPASGVQSGCYYATVNEASGTARTFSVDVLGTAGQAMRIGIYTTAGAMLSETIFTATGYWQRVSVTRTGNANTTRRLYVLRDATASTAKVYVDGLYYSTVNGTYLDGDMRGYLANQIEYRWNGTAHASTSWRSGMSRSGGTMLRIKDYARILFTMGLGLLPFTNIAVPTANGQSVYQNTLPADREIIFNLAFTGNLNTIQTNRAALIEAVRPDKVTPKQSMIIRYQGYDENGLEATEAVDILAHYVDGLQNQPTIPGIERAQLRFMSYMPYMQRAGDSSVSLGYGTSVSNFGDIGYRDTDGQWKAMGTGAPDGAAAGVRALAVGYDGSIYAGGEFSAMGGVLNTAGIARWDGSAWYAMGTGATGGYVFCFARAANGDLYAAGTFTQMGGVANTVRIARWDGAAWNAVGTGIDGPVYALVVDNNTGNLYAGGDFDNAGGGAASNIAVWNGSTWAALGAGVDGAVYGLSAAPNYLYVGGNIISAGGTAVSNVAIWNGSAWAAMGGGLNGVVQALSRSPITGNVYAGGLFTASGLTTTNRVAQWNGTRWIPLNGAGVNDTVYVATFFPDGNLLLSGEFTQIGSYALPDRIAIYTPGGIWLPLDVDIQDDVAKVYAAAVDNSGRIYIGGKWTGTTALSATVTANTGTNPGYPTVTFTGPGTLWQLKNFTTGAAVYFKNLTLAAGEVATLTLNPLKRSFSSNVRSDLMPYITNGSTMSFALVPGANNISCYMTGTTANSAIVMTWQDLYETIDGAKR